MHRRHFLQGLSAIASLGLIHPALSLGRPTAPWAQAFAQALASKPWLVGWKAPAAAKLAAADLAVEGQLPAVLRGTFYRNGPAQHEVGELRYHHIFDGNGMVQALQFTDRGVSHLGRYVETLKYQRETVRGQARGHTFGTVISGVLPPANPAALNVAKKRQGNGCDDFGQNPHLILTSDSL